MTNDSLSFHNGNCEILGETIFCIASFLFHTQNFTFKYLCKHDTYDRESRCPIMVNS